MEHKKTASNIKPLQNNLKIYKNSIKQEKFHVKQCPTYPFVYNRKKDLENNWNKIKSFESENLSFHVEQNKKRNSLFAKNR